MLRIFQPSFTCLPPRCRRRGVSRMPVFRMSVLMGPDLGPPRAGARGVTAPPGLAYDAGVAKELIQDPAGEGTGPLLEVRILSGSRAGEVIALRAPEIVRFGRNPDAEVAF